MVGIFKIEHFQLAMGANICCKLLKKKLKERKEDES